MRREERLLEAGKEPLLDVRLLRIPRLQAGLNTLASQQFMIMGIFFVLPLYLQTVIGYNALETGIRILPLSLSLFVCALLGASLTTRYSPKRIVEVGLLSMLSGGVLLIAFTEPTLRSIGFSVALALVGAGNGLLVSQLGNVIMSSVSSERSGEAGGLQGTAQNLGASLGTALVGSMLIASLVGNFQQSVLANPALADISNDLAALAEENANFVTTDQLRAGAEAAGLSSVQIDALVADYANAQIVALKAAFAVVVLFALIALWYVRRLPSAAQPDDPAALTPSSP